MSLQNPFPTRRSCRLPSTIVLGLSHSTAIFLPRIIVNMKNKKIIRKKQTKEVSSRLYSVNWYQDYDHRVEQNKSNSKWKD